MSNPRKVVILGVEVLKPKLWPHLGAWRCGNPKHPMSARHGATPGLAYALWRYTTEQQIKSWGAL